VYAVEVDPLLAECLAQNVRENGFSDVIKVISGDICSVPLREPIDVFLCEMIDTGLIDEMQAAAINSPRQQSVQVDVRYRMGAGLSSLQVGVV
jgi:predicted RNA methylase